MGLFGRKKKSEQGGQPRGAKARQGYWLVKEHMDGTDSWQCSECRSVFRSGADVCPNCGAENRRVRRDPAWVDELEGFDAMFDDN